MTAPGHQHGTGRTAWRPQRRGLPPAPRIDGIADLSVVVPCYNERPNVAPLVAALDAALTEIAWEVVFVDDDSPDGAAAEARAVRPAGRAGALYQAGRAARTYPHSAVVEGALASSALFVAVMDGDPQHDEDAVAGDAGGAAQRPMRSRGGQPAHWRAATRRGWPRAGGTCCRTRGRGWRSGSCRHASSATR